MQDTRSNPGREEVRKRLPGGVSRGYGRGRQFMEKSSRHKALVIRQEDGADWS